MKGTGMYNGFVVLAACYCMSVSIVDAIGCHGNSFSQSVDAKYAPDHLNYLCKNYTRPTPLPCPRVDASRNTWEPQWGKKFVIFAWWPPVPVDYPAYAEAGFNMALSGAACADHCSRGTELHGENWAPSHDELFDVIVQASADLDSLGVMTVFETENGCNIQLGGPGATTTSYGNRTGGIIEAQTNITSKSDHGGPVITEGERVFSKGQTVPELQYITSELQRRNVSHRFAGVFVHDDTLTQTGHTIAAANWLRENQNWFIPIVNQVSGNSGPQTLYRSGLFISSPEQYPIQCMNGTCAGINATHGAMAQQAAYKSNSLVDKRFALQHWPLFQVGAGNGPLNSTNPDLGRSNVRSDSLFRWMTFAAVAYGARGLNYYCWGGGVWWINQNSSLPGKPTPMYETVKEINADLQKYGDLLVGGEYSFVSSLNTGWMLNGDVSPSATSVVTNMDTGLLVGVFLQLQEGNDGGASAYLMVVDKRVSNQLGMVPARNVTLSLHGSVANAEIVTPGVPKGKGGRGTAPRTLSSPTPHAAVTERWSGGIMTLDVTVEIVGGGGVLVRLSAAPGGEAALRATCFAPAEEWEFNPGQLSLLDGKGLKAPSWAFDTWHHRYRPYANLEITAGRSFEDGEQTAFIVAGSMAAQPSGGSVALYGPSEAQAWAWAGFNVLTMTAPTSHDLESFGASSRALGDLLDWGYSFGYFGVAEPVSAVNGSVLDTANVVDINHAYRCHGRWGGLMLGKNICSNALVLSAVSRSKTLRGEGRGNWVLPLATACDADTAIVMGKGGIPLAMPKVSIKQGHTAVQIGQAVAVQYEKMRQMLSQHWSPVNSGDRISWTNADAFMPFMVAIDACSTVDSDSLLRFQAFASLAYGSRGVYWDGVRRCAGVGTAKFTLVSSINRRIVQWGNTFVSDASDHGYNITRMWSSGWEMTGSFDKVGGPDSLVTSMDDDILVAELGSMGRAATRLIYVVNKQLSLDPGGAPVRELQVVLKKEYVTATQPLEGDCAATACQCGMSNLGNVVHLKLPGGAGQLVAVSTM